VSYVGSPFAHDLFVSYSHGDDGNGQAFLQRWSGAFAMELDRELRAERKFRQELRIFLDKDHRPDHGVDPMAPLTEQLQCEIGVSALLLVLMSPDYLASKWCADERDWWCARQTELGLPADGRIAIVRIWPTEETWPTAFIDSRGNQLVGFPFHAQDEIPARPLGWTDPEGAFGSRFKKALLEIVGSLYRNLDSLKARLDERRRAETEAARLAHDGGQSIYLHGRAVHEQAWERAGMALTDSGFAVVPGEPDPVEHDPKKLQEVRERRVEALTDCDALLLLGTEDGRALDADLVVVGRNDRQSARARSSRLLPCGLLDTVGEPIATSVRRATARNVQVDWLDGTREPWIPEVQRWLLDKSAQAGTTR
jgi:hypothetical protein